MNKIYLLLTGAICLTICRGCNDAEQLDFSDVTVIEVDISKSTLQDLSNEVEIVEIIPLETTGKSMIRNIDKLYVTDTHILVADLRKSEIFLFDRNGFFKNKIGQKGRGPSEYLMFDDVQYNPQENLIYTHERLKHQMHVYNLDGKLMNEKEYHQWLDSFIKTEEGYWLYTCYIENDEDGYALKLMNDKFETVLAEFLPQKAFFTTTFLPRFLQDEQGKVYFAYPYSNVIYSLENKKPEPCYMIDFKHQTLPYGEIKQMGNNSQYEQLLTNKKYLGDLKNLILCDNKLYFSFSELSSSETTLYHAVYDVITSKIDIYDRHASFTPSIPQKYRFKDLALIDLVCSYDKHLIYSVLPYRLSENDLTIIKKEVSPEVTSESNPLLFFVKRK